MLFLARLTASCAYSLLAPLPHTYKAWLYTHSRTQGRVSCSQVVPRCCRFAITGSEDSTARVWDLQAPPLVDDHNHAGKVHCMSVTPDGATAVSVAADGCAMVWDVQSGSCRHTLKGHTTALHWASLASDGRTLLTVAGDRSIKAWDIETGTCGTTLPSKPCPPLLLSTLQHVNAASFCPMQCSACHVAVLDAVLNQRLWFSTLQLTQEPCHT